MNKRGWVALPIIVLAFWFGIFLFYSNLDSQSPGGEALYLGEHSIELYEVYYEAELDSYYYELAAKLSAKKAKEDNFETEFKQYFSEYLEKSNLVIEDFDISISSGESEYTVLIKSKESLVYDKGTFTYSIPYSFSVSKEITSKEEQTSSTQLLA